METYLPIPYTIQKYNIHKQDSIKHFAELQKSKIKPKKIKAMKDLTPVGQLKNEKIYRFNIILDKKIFNVFYAKNEDAWLLEYPDFSTMMIDVYKKLGFGAFLNYTVRTPKGYEEPVFDEKVLPEVLAYIENHVYLNNHTRLFLEIPEPFYLENDELCIEPEKYDFKTCRRVSVDGVNRSRYPKPKKV